MAENNRQDGSETEPHVVKKKKRKQVSGITKTNSTKQHFNLKTSNHPGREPLNGNLPAGSSLRHPEAQLLSDF